jgi:Flp pilus assembly protein TadG
MNDDDPMSHTIRQAIRRFLVGEDGIAGAALVEFTLVAPLLVVMSIYTMDFGLYLYRQMQVQNAAQAGVDWAIANHIFNNADITAAVNNATLSDHWTASDPITLPTDTLNPNPIERCGCPSSSGMTFTPNTAPAPCPTCSGSVGGLYVTVQTQATWKSFIQYGLFSSATRVLTAQATARIQ